MNKLLIDEVEFIAENIEKKLITKKNHLELICKEKNNIILSGNELTDIKIILLDESTLKITLEDNLWKQCNISIVQHNRSDFDLKGSFKTKKQSSLVLKNKIIGNNNKSNIHLRCIAYQDMIEIKVIAEVDKLTKNNEIIEDIKGIEYGGKIKIQPDMYIYTNEVIANHYVTIGTIDKDAMFYLESKGLSKTAAEKLILDGFLK